MFALFWLSIICTLLLATAAIYNIVKLTNITKTPIYKINELRNNKHISLQATLVPTNKNNLISPITKKPCCWYRLSLEISNVIPILQGSLWRPLEKFSEDRVIEAQDNTGKALLATHLARVYTNNNATFYLNTRPNLRDPEEMLDALQESNANVFIKGANWLNTRNLHVADTTSRSAFSSLRSYIVPFVYRITEEVLVDHQDIFILGENHLVDGPLLNGPLGDTSSSLAYNLYVEKHGLGEIKNFISAGDAHNNFIICSDVGLVTVEYKLRSILYGLSALAFLVLTVWF